ncbi:MAG: CehA/McbA family metallohydrolase [Planctomycetota bacterium]|nr:CehA/McbA family metallohydrolase [Planctomycetota bacterium]
MLAAGWTNPFNAPGTWLRANLHAHTTASDGKVDLATRAGEYAAAGYGVLAITDHHAFTRLDGAQAPKGLTLLPGAELHPDNPFGGDRYHFVCLGLTGAHDARVAAHPQEVLDDVNARGGLVYLAHPYWCRHTLRDLEPLRGYAGVEVFNDSCRDAGRPESSSQWDDLLHAGTLSHAIATDDCHHAAAAKIDVFGGWTWIRAAEPSREAVVAALRAGLNYASCGPRILELSVEDHVWKSKDAGKPDVPSHRLRVKTSAAREIFFLSDRGGGFEAAPEGGTLEAAEFLVRPGSRYVRIEVLDTQGRKAWSNPVPFTW